MQIMLYKYAYTVLPTVFLNLKGTLYKKFSRRLSAVASRRHFRILQFNMVAMPQASAQLSLSWIMISLRRYTLNNISCSPSKHEHYDVVQSNGIVNLPFLYNAFNRDDSTLSVCVQTAFADFKIVLNIDPRVERNFCHSLQTGIHPTVFKNLMIIRGD